MKRPAFLLVLVATVAGVVATVAAAGSWGILNSTVTRTVGLGANRQIEFGLRVNF
ncbi:MAG TPA: hypothetical protein VNM47_15430 [Terriglobia bacterium]|nr:hypothetical protein [Terriglobia bacterium]